MTGTVTNPDYQEKLFCYDLDGLSFTVKVYTTDGLNFFAKIIVDEGAADFNALYWGDDVNDGHNAGLGGNLNMNGAKDCDGQTVDWDGAVKLSSPGLGNHEDTYLQEGEYLTFALPGVDSFDDVDNLGVRATSTSTPEGSIKAVGEPYCACDHPDGDDSAIDDGRDDGLEKDGQLADNAELAAGDDTAAISKIICDFVPEWPQDISNVVFYFDPDGTGEPTYSVKIDGFTDGAVANNDLDAYIDDMLYFIASENPEIVPGTALMGISIKGGKEETQYFSIANDTNGSLPDPDDAPERLLNTGPGLDQELYYHDFMNWLSGGSTVEQHDGPEHDEAMDEAYA